jgi:O-antigen/teichoic acid export membrane protein
MPHDHARRVSRNAVLLFLGTVCRLGLSFAFVVYVAVLLGVDGFGTYSLGLHYFELFLSLTATAVGIYVTREAGRRLSRLSQLLSHGLVLVVGLSIAGACLLVVLGQILNYAPDTRDVLRIAALALLPASAAVVMEAAFVSLEQTQYVTAGTVLESLVRIAASYVALVAGLGLASLFWILVVTRAALALYYLAALSGRIPLRWRFRRRRFAVFAWRWRVFAAENWLATIYTSLDVVILSAFHGEAAVGLYTAARKVVRLGSVAAKCYTTAVFPLLARWYVESRAAFDQLNRDTLRFLLAAMLPATATVALLADRIVALLFADEYAGAAPVLQVLAWVMLLECMNPFLSHTLFAKGQQHDSMLVAGISLLANLAATTWLAYQWGAVGAAWGTLVGALVACGGYCRFSLGAGDAYRLLAVAAKVFLAAAGFALVLAWPNSGHGVAALAVASLVYLLLVVVFRVVTATDLRGFQRQIES